MSTNSPSSTAGMITARRRDSETKRVRVLAALQHLHEQGAPITFAAVARQAGVSTWLVYAPGVREHIDHARQHPRSSHARDDQVARALETDLALARAEIRKLRAERDQHQRQMQRALGARLDNLAKADLLAVSTSSPTPTPNSPPPSSNTAATTTPFRAGSPSSKTTSPRHAPACAA